MPLNTRSWWAFRRFTPVSVDSTDVLLLNTCSASLLCITYTIQLCTLSRRGRHMTSDNLCTNKTTTTTCNLTGQITITHPATDITVIIIVRCNHALTLVLAICQLLPISLYRSVYQQYRNQTRGLPACEPLWVRHAQPSSGSPDVLEN